VGLGAIDVDDPDGAPMRSGSTAELASEGDLLAVGREIRSKVHGVRRHVRQLAFMTAVDVADEKPCLREWLCGITRCDDLVVGERGAIRRHRAAVLDAVVAAGHLVDVAAVRRDAAQVPAVRLRRPREEDGARRNPPRPVVAGVVLVLARDRLNDPNEFGAIRVDRGQGIRFAAPDEEREPSVFVAEGIGA
jgi:hypothetical protein